MLRRMMTRSMGWGGDDRGRLVIGIPAPGGRLLGVLMLSLGWVVGSQAQARTDDRRPNFVVIVADDLGWGDVGWNGSAIGTPYLDRLAREGMVLDQHYVSPMCTPTRTALLSGRYASRFGVTVAQNGPAFFEETLTLAEVLREAGYATAMTGKWHLGSTAEWGPNRRGFESAHGSLAGGVTPYSHRYKIGEYSETWHRDGRLLDEEGHVTDLITREAVRWIEANAKGDRPFFLYVPYTAPHVPIKEPAEWLDRYPPTSPVAKRHYAASVSHMDDGVGQILAALDRTGQASDTVVLFFSDNGADPEAPNNNGRYPGTFPAGAAGGSNLPLRGIKGEVLEGGIRVPAVVRWPGRLSAGQFGAPVHVVDWMPTFCALADCSPRLDPRWDGRNIWPALRGAEPLPIRPLYWAGGYFREAAVREGDWKLIEDRVHDQVRLFNLATDPFEQHDLAAGHADRVMRLKHLIAELATADTPARSGPAK